MLLDALRVPALRWPLLSFLVFRAVETAAWVTLLVWAHAWAGAAAAGLLAAVLLLPGVVVASLGSVVASRAAPLRVLRLGYVAQCVAALCVGAALLMGAPDWSVVLLGAALMASCALTRPAHHALVPLLARAPDELTVGNTGSSAAQALGELLGPAVAAGLLMTVRFGWVFVVIAVLAAIATVGVSVVRPVHRDVLPAGHSLIAQARDGLRVVARDPAAGVLTGMFAGQFVVFGLLRVLVVVLGIDLLMAGPSGPAVLSAALGLGALIGSLLTVLLIGRSRLAPSLLAGVAVTSVPIALLGAVGQLVPALLLLAAVGLGQALFDVSARTLLHRSVDPRALVRLFGVQETVLVAGAVLGALLVPGLVAVAGSRGAFLIAGVLLPVLGLLAWTRIRELDRTSVLPGPALEVLRGIPMFAVLPQPQLEQLARALEPEPIVPAGDTVVEQGQAGDRYYVILSGTAVVRRGDRVLDELGTGDGFGEIALLRDVPRTASVVATSDLEVASLAREAFLLAVTGSTASLRAVDSRVDAMLEQEDGEP